MGKAFFTGWALWEKMVFVLACAIVVTILLGCLKLLYTSWRVRKYASLPPKKVSNLDREKSIIRSLSRRSAKLPMTEKHRRVRSINDGIEVPFGIRAIESGIEVDGVWISRSNTPIPSTRQSSASSLWGKAANSSTSNLSQIEAQETSRSHTASPLASSRAPSRDLDHSTPSDPSCPDLIAQPSRARYPPHSYGRYENTRHFRNSHTLDTRSFSRHKPVSSYYQPDSAESSSNRSSASDSDASRKDSNESNGSNNFPIQYPSPYREGLTLQQRSTSNNDLDMLHSHRLSHAAEIGQLLPRTRRAGNSGEWASIANFAPTPSGQSGDLSMPGAGSPTSPSSTGSNPFKTPTSPTAPELPGSSEPRLSEDGRLPTVRRASSSLSYEQPDATVLRQVNSGFSILRPGTLDAQAQRGPPKVRSLSRSASDESKSDKRQSRRLQKKRRPSMESRRSSLSEKGYFAASAPQASINEDGMKYAFTEGERPPSEAEAVRGAQIEAVGANTQEDVLHLAIKQYTPLDNTSPQPGDVTIIGAHANGFPKELYEPLWDELYQRLKANNIRIRGIWIADVAHQGASSVLNEDLLGNDPSWFDHPRDLFLMINHFRAQMPQPLIGVGHSMGGAHLINLALIHPRLLSTLILMDPVVQRAPNPQGNYLPAKMSAVRRDRWPSRAAARTAFKKSKFYQTWDPRVLDLWIEHGLRELPTKLYPAVSSASATPPALSADPAAATVQLDQTTEREVTLTTPKHQEVMTFMRANLNPQTPPDALTHPDLDEASGPTSPFYRPEPIALFARLPNLRPSVLYIFGSESNLSAPPLRADKMAVTGSGVSGSGGAEKGRVREVLLQGIGHLIPMETVGVTADHCSVWVAKELARFREESARVEAMRAGIPREKRALMTDEYYKTATGDFLDKKQKAKL
ncbi:hypothetical protein MBLNU459_g6463t1 [Dothideomycetes sp. NU459]